MIIFGPNIEKHVKKRCFHPKIVYLSHFDPLEHYRNVKNDSGLLQNVHWYFKHHFQTFDNNFPFRVFPKKSKIQIFPKDPPQPEEDPPQEISKFDLNEK